MFSAATRRTGHWLFAAIVACGLLLVTPEPSTAATSPAVELEGQYTKVLADGRAGRVYIVGASDAPWQVRAADGTLLDEQPVSEPVGSPELSPDGTAIWGLNGSSLVAVDTETFAATTYDLGVECVGSVAPAPEGVYFVSGCSISQRHYGLLDPASGHVVLSRYVDRYAVRGHVQPIPSQPGSVVTWGGGRVEVLQMSVVQGRLWFTSSVSATLDLWSVSPDATFVGEDLVAIPPYVLRVSDLRSRGRLTIEGGKDLVDPIEVGADGLLASTAGGVVRFFAPQTRDFMHAQRLSVDAPDHLYSFGLDVVGGTPWVLSGRAGTSTTTLSFVVVRPSATVSVKTPRRVAYDRETVRLTLALSSPSPDRSVRVEHVVPGEEPEVVGTFEVPEGATRVVRVSPAGGGFWRAVYEGDASVEGAVARSRTIHLTPTVRLRPANAVRDRGHLRFDPTRIARVRLTVAPLPVECVPVTVMVQARLRRGPTLTTRECVRLDENGEAVVRVGLSKRQRRLGWTNGFFSIQTGLVAVDGLTSTAASRRFSWARGA